MIIGITGTLGAGKGTIVEYLTKKGFKHYSSSGLIVEEIKNRDMPVNRDSMVIVGDDLREKFGPGYIPETLYERAKKEGGSSVIEALRAIGEIEALRAKGECYIFSVDADPKIRYERIKKRAGSKDDVSYETFLQNEEREMANTEPFKMNLSACIKMADYAIDNSGTKEDMYDQVDRVLSKIN